MLTNEPRQDICGGGWIERFLSDQLAAEQIVAFEDHLEVCAVCRRELDARAADEVWWSRMRDCLADTDLSQASDADAASLPDDGAPSWDSPGSAQATLAAIKPYLAPTDDPRMMGRVGPYEIVGVRAATALC